MGTSTQLGQVVGVSIEIYDFSTPDDHQLLVTAFEKGQNNALVNTLCKMKAVGHCSITGTLGYDVSYIRMIPTPRTQDPLVTNRQLRMGEVYTTRSPNPSTLPPGSRYQRHRQEKEHRCSLSPLPACYRQRGQLQFQLAQNRGNWLTLSIGKAPLALISVS
jgi:hypothetical protein